MSLARFQLAGDVTHLAAVVLLPIKLQWSTNASGVSLITQELYLLVFLTRYLGLLIHTISLYNSAMKVLLVFYTAITIAMLRFQPQLRASCEKCPESFRPKLHAVIPCLLLSTAIYLWDFGFEMHGFFSLEKFWWTFSELLEPVVIIPQLIVLRRCRNAGLMTWCYVSLMAVYRAPYILAWAQTAHDKPSRGAYEHLFFLTALAQICVYAVFFGITFTDHLLLRGRRSFGDADGNIDGIEAGFSSMLQRLLLDRSSCPASGGACLSTSASEGVQLNVDTATRGWHGILATRADKKRTRATNSSFVCVA